MSEETEQDAPMEATALVPAAMLGELSVSKSPDVVLTEAKRAAEALLKMVKEKKLSVRIGKKDHLFVEAWETLGTFYGVTAKITKTEEVAIGEARGFKARAEVVLISTGRVISAAECMCLNDEDRWKTNPTFQLLSMAQTRAISKSLRNVLAWIVVLAGYDSTPAEEMTGKEYDRPESKPRPKSTPAQDGEKDTVEGIVESAAVTTGKYKLLKVKFKGEATDYTTFDNQNLSFQGDAVPIFEFIPQYAPTRKCVFKVAKNKSYWNIMRVVQVGEYSWDKDGDFAIDGHHEDLGG